jgi:hypothetical protein
VWVRQITNIFNFDGLSIVWISLDELFGLCIIDEQVNFMDNWAIWLDILFQMVQYRLVLDIFLLMLAVYQVYYAGF